MGWKREVGRNLAIVTAMDKAIKRAKADIRNDAREMLAAAYERDGVSGVDLLIGDEKVGKASMGTPAVGVYADGEFDRWAYESGMGTRSLTVDVSGVPDERLEELVGVVEAAGYPHRVECRADDAAKRSLKVRGGAVVDANGEVVPGTYVKARDIRVTGCDPEDVGEAMRLVGDGKTVAGLLSPSGEVE